MLINSRKKFIGMIIGATFSAFIIMQQPSVYQGVTDRLVAQIQAIQEVDLWVMDKNSFTFDNPTHFNVMDIYRIRSIPGVLWAVQLYRGWYTFKHLKTNKSMTWELIGVDPETLIGLPKEMMTGARTSIYNSNSVLIDGYSLKQLETESKETVALGDKLVKERSTWIVSAVTKPLRTYSDQPLIYMTSNHLPDGVHTPSFILVKVKPPYDVSSVAREIHQITQYHAFTPEQFASRSNTYFREKTPIVMGFISIAVIGFTIGLIMMWQIFSNFVVSHLHQFGMLKMLGVSNSLLMKMVLFQAFVTGGVGYILGFLLTLLFGLLTYDSIIAFHLTWEIAFFGALGIIVVTILSSCFCILNAIRFDTIDLCRDLN